MRLEDSFVVLSFCLFAVERLNEILGLQQGMGVPLLWAWDEGCSSNEILVVIVVGRAATAKLGGRDILAKRWKSREFDATKGYPGEDGARTTV